jgi:hypothetical protein
LVINETKNVVRHDPIISDGMQKSKDAAIAWQTYLTNLKFQKVHSHFSASLLDSLLRLTGIVPFKFLQGDGSEDSIKKLLKIMKDLDSEYFSRSHLCLLHVDGLTA